MSQRRHLESELNELVVKHVGEDTPLLPKLAEIKSQDYFQKRIELIVCAAVAFPTAALNGLSALVDNPEDLMQLDSLSALGALLHRSNLDRIAVAVGAFSLSQGVFLYMNSLYFVSSGKAAANLIKRMGYTGASIISCNLDTLSPQDCAKVSEVGLFVWSIGSSLIFAEMGSQGLSFLGTKGENVGYFASLLVYFSTRYASTKFFNVNERLKKHYLDKLELLADDASLAPIDVQDKLNDALIEFLRQVDDQWDRLSKSQSRVILLGEVAPFIGYASVLITLLPIMSSFIPLAVQGAEKPTGWDIGKSEQYQNVSSLTFGAFSAALTLFFYELGIYELPKHFARTALLMYDKVQEGDTASVAGLLLMTALALGASCSTGMGFKTMADDAVKHEYLSYLGKSLSHLMPTGLFIATAGMLWSHLQGLVNKIFTPQPVAVTPSEVYQIEVSNVRSLLTQTSVDFSGLRSRSGFFTTRPTVISSDTSTPVYEQASRSSKSSRCVIL